MKLITKLSLFFVPLLVAVSCVNDDYDPVKCGNVEEEEVRLRIEFEWIETEPIDTEETVSVMSVCPAGQIGRLSSPVEGTEAWYEPDFYHFAAWEPVERAAIDGELVYVIAEGERMSVEPMPFSAGTANVEVEEDVPFQIIHIPMRSQVRELIINIKFTGYGASMLTGAEGTLEGVALTRLIDFGFPPAERIPRPPAVENGWAPYLFTPADNDWFSGSERLLGIDGNVRQELELVAFLRNGEYADAIFDVTEALDGFHTENLPGPYYINLLVNAGADFTLTLLDWSNGGEYWLIAD